MEKTIELHVAQTPMMQRGENNHLEYGWSEELQEQILQFHFQLLRCNSKTQENLANRLESILQTCIENQEQIHLGKYQELMITMYKMIGYTRDIIHGKGEIVLAYMQILIWYKFYPELAKFALKCFVHCDEMHPYGSWKDIKYFCNYCIQCGYTEEFPLIQYALFLVTNQLRLDEISTSKTLLAKWIPREKSKKFGWIFDKLSELYFPKYFETAKTPEQKIPARLKAKTEYRRIISKLNKLLHTVQIKQCDNQWSSIDHSKTTSITMITQKKAFLNLTHGFEPRVRSLKEDRIHCAKNLHDLILNKSESINGKRVGLNTFTKNALRLLQNRGSQMEIDLLNLQWKNFTCQFSDLGPMIAMVDCSDFMQSNDNANPYCSALALGCLIAEKSTLGKRVLVFNEKPSWHNLDMCDTFTSMIESIKSVEKSPSTNFYNALDIILDAVVEKKLTSDDVSGMVLVILSDMQVTNKENAFDVNTLYDTMKEKYAETGIRICGTGYEPPHILFWNLRSTTGFPCLSDEKNVTMISGYHPSILRRFSDKITRGFRGGNPWTTLIESMNKNRYKCMENKIKTELGFFE